MIPFLCVTRLLQPVQHVQGIIHAQPDQNWEGGDDHRRQGQIEQDG